MRWEQTIRLISEEVGKRRRGVLVEEERVEECVIVCSLVGGVMTIPDMQAYCRKWAELDGLVRRWKDGRRLVRRMGP